MALAAGGKRSAEWLQHSRSSRLDRLEVVNDRLLSVAPLVSFAPSFLAIPRPTDEKKMELEEEDNDMVVAVIDSPFPLKINNSNLINSRAFLTTNDSEDVLFPAQRTGLTTHRPDGFHHVKGGKAILLSSRVVALSKRLQARRDACRADAVRLRSGQYPFKVASALTKAPSTATTPEAVGDTNGFAWRGVASIHDTGNPRRRAQSFVDVTVLGDNPTFWTGGDLRSPTTKFNVLGYIHDWGWMQDRQQSGEQRLGAPCIGWAWLCVMKETMQEQQIARGTELRIYDAIVVPCSDSDVRQMVLCTQLCEAYPSAILPALSIPQEENDVV